MTEIAKKEKGCLIYLNTVYIYGNMIDSVEILTEIVRFPMKSSKKVSPNDCDNDRQPEIAIWQPKPKILISLELS